VFISLLKEILKVLDKPHPKVEVHVMWHTPTPLDKFKCESKNENIGRKKS
jgi:hypothetical protein